MTIHWILFVPAVLLLLFPADRLMSSAIELRSFDCFQSLENSPRFRPWWWVPVLWLDPIRAFAGTWLLLEGLALKTGPWDPVPVGPYVLVLAVLIAGGAWQTFTRRGDRGVLLAPVGYVAGVVCALTPWSVSLLAIVSAALGLFAFRKFHAFFAFGSGAVALLGFALGAELAWIAPAVGVFALPIVAGLVTASTLEIPTRNASRPPSVS